MNYKTRLILIVPTIVLALLLGGILKEVDNPDAVSLVLNIGIGVVVVGVLVYFFVLQRRTNKVLAEIRQPSVGFQSVGLPQLWRQLGPLLPADFERPAIQGGGFYLSVTAKTFALCADDEDLTDLLELPTTGLYSIEPGTATQTSSGQLGAGRPAIDFFFLREENDSDVVLTIAVLESQDRDELLGRLRELLTMAR